MKKLIFLLAALLALTFVFTSCSDSDDDTANVTGTVKNITDTPVPNAIVTLGGVTVATDVNGQYMFSNIAYGAVNVTVSANGYNNSTKTIEVAGNTTLDFKVKGEAAINGTILDSQTGMGIGDVEIEFYAGTKSNIGTVLFVITTDEYGYYSMDDLPVGSFMMIAVLDGYVNLQIPNVVLDAGDNYMGESTIVEEVQEGELRVVLTWGESPFDLDTHLTGPTTSGERFHIYFVDRYVDDGTIADLDVDDVSSYGPETTTLKEMVDGMYRYSIYNYSNQTSTGAQGIYDSPTQVSIYNHNGLYRSYTAPALASGEEGNTWRVFEFTVVGTTITVTDINTYLTAANSGDINSFKNSSVKPEMIFNGTDF